MPEQVDDWDDKLGDLSIESTTELCACLVSGLFILCDNNEYVTLAPQASLSPEEGAKSLKLLSLLHQIGFPSIGRVQNGQISSIMDIEIDSMSSLTKTFDLTKMFSLAHKLGITPDQLFNLVRVNGKQSSIPKI